MRLGRFVVVGEIGRGGAGVVYRARSDDGTFVAIKLLRDMTTSERRARFAREERLLASFGAKEGFVPLLERGDAPQGPYLVMPFLTGGTLRARLARGPLPIDEAVRVVERIALALGAAHAKGVVHRDVKPENVLFDEQDEPFLADLGLAKHYSEDAPGASRSVSLSGAGDYRGSVGYSAPEHLTGSKEAEPPADVFSLGIVLYECLTGASPFPGDTLMDVVTRIARGDVQDPRRLRREIPRWLVQVVKRCLTADPLRRYADGFALADALGAAPVRRRRALTVLGLLVLAAVLAGGLLAARAGLRARWETPPPPPPSGRDLVAKAEELRARRALDEALAAATAATELDPALARGWALLGELEADRALLDRAEDHFTRALALDKDAASVWVARAAVRERKHDADGARADLDRALVLDPRSAKGWALRGVVRLEQKDAAGAVSDLTRAMDADPEHAREVEATYVRALERRGLARAGAGDADGALADYDAALARDPGYALAWKGRAEVEYGRSELDAASADAQRAIDADPSLSWAWYIRGAVKQRKGDLDAAIRDFDHAIELDPGYAGAYSDRATAKGMRGDLEGALQDAQRAVEIEPRKIPGAWSNLARAKFFQRDFEGAVAAATRAIEISGGMEDAFRTRAEARIETNDLTGAIEDATTIIAHSPRNPFAWHARGEARARSGDDAGARTDLERALELEPSLGPEIRRRLDTLRARVAPR